MPLSVSVGDAVRAPGLIGGHFHPEMIGSAPEVSETDEGQQSLPGLEALWWDTGEQDQDEEDTREQDDNDGWYGWEITDDSGQSLAGLPQPMFDTIVADEVSGFDIGDIA
jgi:hypothetical protein